MLDDQVAEIMQLTDALEEASASIDSTKRDVSRLAKEVRLSLLSPSSMDERLTADWDAGGPAGAGEGEGGGACGARSRVALERVGRDEAHRGHLQVVRAPFLPHPSARAGAGLLFFPIRAPLTLDSVAGTTRRWRCTARSSASGPSRRAQRRAR